MSTELKTIDNLDEFLTASTPREFDYVQVNKTTRVRIGSVSALEWVEWKDAQTDPESRRLSSFTLIARSLVNEKGDRIGTVEQARKLMEVNMRVSETLLKAIMKLNGVSQSKAVEEAKND
jgi:hypothetical protein